MLSHFGTISAGVSMPFVSPSASFASASANMSRSLSMSSSLNWAHRTGSFSPTAWPELGLGMQQLTGGTSGVSATSPAAAAAAAAAGTWAGVGADPDSMAMSMPGGARAPALHWSFKRQGRGLSASPSFPPSDVCGPLGLMQLDPELQLQCNVPTSALHRSITSDSIRADSLQVDPRAEPRRFAQAMC